jgi:hypothetical protein
MADHPPTFEGGVFVPPCPFSHVFGPDRNGPSSMPFNTSVRPADKIGDGGLSFEMSVNNTTWDVDKANLHYLLADALTDGFQAAGPEELYDNILPMMSKLMWLRLTPFVTYKRSDMHPYTPPDVLAWRMPPACQMPASLGMGVVNRRRFALTPVLEMRTVTLDARILMHLF